MIFKREIKHWYKQSATIKQIKIYQSLKRCGDDDSVELILLKSRNLHTGRKRIELQLIHYTRFIHSFVFAAIVFFIATNFMTPPIKPDIAFTLALFFIPIGGFVLSSAIGDYTRYLIALNMASIDDNLHATDNYTFTQYGFRALDEDAY